MHAGVRLGFRVITWGSNPPTWLELFAWLDGGTADCSVARDGVIGGVMSLALESPPSRAACAEHARFASTLGRASLLRVCSYGHAKVIHALPRSTLATLQREAAVTTPESFETRITPRALQQQVAMPPEPTQSMLHM